MKPVFATTWETNKTTPEFRTVFHSPLGVPNSQVPLYITEWNHVSIFFLFQAFIFWVVDNFLKKKIRKSSNQVNPINGNDSAMRYFKSSEKVRYYRKCDQTENSESDMDILLQTEEEPESATFDSASASSAHRRTQEQHCLLNPV